MKSLKARTICILIAALLLMNTLLPAIAVAVETGTEPAQEETVATEPLQEETVPTEFPQEETAANAGASSIQAPSGYIPQDEILEVPDISVMAEEGEALPKVLLIEDVLPWNSTANQVVLGKITEFDKTTTTEFLNVELEEYGVVVFANDQPFDTYQNYEEFKEYLELFANLGGVIVFGACDSGWAEGELNEMLPGDVSKKTHYVTHNYVADTSHPIVTGTLTDSNVLLDEDLVGSYCSHVSFDEESIPAGSKVILRESDSNRPTLVEYPLGEGRVIASGLTWEFAYTRGGVMGAYAEIGYYAEKAMEDMFRYAIRVSNIDVDELHLLEEWRMDKKSHVIVVADSAGGMDNLSPIPGAKVTVDGVEYIADEDGIVKIKDYGMKTVSVSAAGYRDCKEYYEVAEQKSRIFLLEKDKNDGMPYVTMCTAAKNGKTPYVDLRTQALHFTEGKGTMLILWLEGNWNGHGEGTFNIIQQAADGKPGNVIEIPAGNYLNYAPGKYYEPNAQIKLQMVAADGTKSELIDLNIEIDKAPVVGGPTENTPIQEGVTTMDWLGNYPIKSDNDVFTKLLTTDMSISSDLIPVEFAVTHNADGTITYKGLIGFATGEGSKNLLNNKSNEEDFEMKSAWEELKDQIKNYKKAKNPKQYWKNLENKYGKMLHGTKLRASVDTSVKVCGFVELTVNSNNEIIKSDGGLIVNGSAHAVIGKTFFAGPVPLYFEFRPGVEAEASAGITFYNEENGLTIKPFFNGLDLAIPSISLEGGVGVRGVATAGLNGTGKLMVSLPGTDDPKTNVDLTLDGSVHIKVLFVADYKWSFASTKIHFYPKENAAALTSLSMDNGTGELSVVTRAYREKATQWNEGAVTQMSQRSGAETVTTLQEGVMPEAMPQLHQIGDKQIMLFLRDVADRATGNHTQLVYSVGQDGVWSEPQPVWESDTADFYFSSCVADDQLVVAWQKSATAVNAEDAEALLEQVVRSSEICFATWNQQLGAFADQKYLTDNQLVDMMPAVASDGETVTVSWVCNDANNVLGSGGNYLIYQTSIAGGKAEAPELLYTTEDYVVELASGMTEDGAQMIFSAMNAEDTVDLYSLNDGEAQKLVSSENPAGLSFAEGMFLWHNDGDICSFVPGGQTVETLVSGDVVSASSSYEYVTNGTSKALIWSEATEAGYVVKASVHCGGTWSKAVTLLTGAADTVSFMDAVMQENGNYALVLNTASYVAGELDATALQYANIVPRTSVSVELAETEHPDWENGTQEICISLENTGSVPVYSAELTVSCENGTLLSETVALELLPGESQLITRVMDIRSIDREMDGTVSVLAANDIDDSDNVMTFTLGQVDVELRLDAYENGDQFLFVLTAANDANTVANAALSIIEDSLDGVVLNMKNIGAVSSDENVQYLFSIDRSKVDFADKETKTYFFTLSTLETDWYDGDNVCTYTIKAPANAETDPEGEMETITIVQPEKVEIVEEALHFYSLDDESVQLHAVVYPEEASVTAVYWSAENNDIVHITEDGLVTPLREGTTTITAMVMEGILDTITVTVVTVPETPAYTITFDANGGLLEQTSATTNAAGTLDLLPTPVKDGYNFLGWFTAVIGGEQVTVSTVFTEDTTIYAQWEKAENPDTPDTPSDPTDPSAPSAPTEEETDTTALEQAIAKTRKLKEKDYTKKSWSAMKAALKVAEKVLADEDASQEEIDNAADALNKAIKALAPATGKNPETGDSFALTLASGFVALSLLGAAALVLNRRKLF